MSERLYIKDLPDGKYQIWSKETNQAVSYISSKLSTMVRLLRYMRTA